MFWGHPNPRQGAVSPLDPRFSYHYLTRFDITSLTLDERILFM